jgi:hypothetical protein
VCVVRGQKLGRCAEPARQTVFETQFQPHTTKGHQLAARSRWRKLFRLQAKITHDFRLQGGCSMLIRHSGEMIRYLSGMLSSLNIENKNMPRESRLQLNFNVFEDKIRNPKLDLKRPLSLPPTVIIQTVMTISRCWVAGIKIFKCTLLRTKLDARGRKPT